MRRVDAPRRLLIDLDVVDHRVHPLAAPAREHAPHLGGAGVEPIAQDLLGAVAVGGLDAELAVRLRQRDEHEPRADELAQAARDEVEEAIQVELHGERVADLDERLELAQPARRRLVQPRVLDRDGGLRGEQRDDAPGRPP